MPAPITSTRSPGRSAEQRDRAPALGVELGDAVVERRLEGVAEAVPGVRLPRAESIRGVEGGPLQAAGSPCQRRVAVREGVERRLLHLFQPAARRAGGLALQAARQRQRRRGLGAAEAAEVRRGGPARLRPLPGRRRGELGAPPAGAAGPALGAVGEPRVAGGDRLREAGRDDGQDGRGPGRAVGCVPRAR